MGCFSFNCLCCGRPIRSNSFRGERVKLFLLKNSVVIETMSGEYTSYGRVFDDNSAILQNGEIVEYSLSKDWETMKWEDIVDELMFDEAGEQRTESGIAAIHQKCIDRNTKFELIPKISSEQDPSQGWGPFSINGKRFK